jgi:DNA-binding winged helix-turn-helix (wHTH) protein
MQGKVQFGAYELDCDAMELRKHGVPIRLQEQPCRVLAALVERPGEIVTREELRERIWPKDTFVDFDQSLNKAVNRAREALNDDAGTPQYIETVPRRGYRFIAPVTGIPRTEANVSTQQINAGLAGKPAKSGFHGPPWIGTDAALIAAGALVAAGVFAVSWLKRPEKPTSWEARRMTSAGFAPALSRDGKLLTFVSAIGGDVQHIWLEQTAGGEAIPVTKGADTDFPPVDFSPDGTHIAFASTRGGGGLYIAPTLPGEPRLLVSSPEASSPRFSPGGQEILYFEDHKLFKVSVDGGQPVALTLNQEFLVDYPPPLWAPSGNEIIFYGVSRREPDTTRWGAMQRTLGRGRQTPISRLRVIRSSSICRRFVRRYGWCN